MAISTRTKKWTMFSLRWAVAVVGITYVVANISWRDRVLVILNPGVNRPVEARVYDPVREDFTSVTILDPVTGAVVEVSRDQLVNEADRDEVTLLVDGRKVKVPLLAVDLTDSMRDPAVERLLVADPDPPAGAVVPPGVWVEPLAAPDYRLRVPYPLVQSGLRHMLWDADPLFLWGAVFIFPITYLVTGIRWHLLLKALEINLGFARAFVLNMVGAFYSTFMPGSTGGDLLKAYYAAKQVPAKRTRAVMSVLIDRIIGLVALILLGGAMAALQWDEPACRQVALASGATIVLLVVGLFVFYHPTLRRATGMAFVLRRLPMQAQVAKAVETMEIYRQRPGLVLGTVVMTFPVHITVILSATLAGMAFGLPLSPLYYWVVVPVVVLSGSVPISPQGAGVMEFFAILLTRSHGATVAEAFALAMSIRLVQVLWNLTGGIFVLRGGFQAPTEAEQEALTGSDAPPDDAQPRHTTNDVATEDDIPNAAPPRHAGL